MNSEMGSCSKCGLPIDKMGMCSGCGKAPDECDCSKEEMVKGEEEMEAEDKM